MVEHVDITDPEIHEPKGVAAASAGEVYLADGAGSGSWGDITLNGQDAATPGQVFVSDGAGSGDWMNQVVNAWENIDHAGGNQVLLSGVKTKMLNDALGGQSNISFSLPGSTGVWDSVGNQFNWGDCGLTVGDTAKIRLDIAYTVNTANDGFNLEMDMAVGGAFPFTLPIDTLNIDQSGTLRTIRSIDFFVGSTDILDNPAELYITADSAGDSIQVNGWYVELKPRRPVYE